MYDYVTLFRQLYCNPKFFVRRTAHPNLNKLILNRCIIKLKIHPKQLIRFKEDKAKELGISAGDQLTNEQWVTIMAKNPVLIERPIVITDTGAVIGRPPENVLKVLD